MRIYILYLTILLLVLLFWYIFNTKYSILYDLQQKSKVKYNICKFLLLLINLTILIYLKYSFYSIIYSQ
jgi:hypothetical protein